MYHSIFPHSCTGIVPRSIALPFNHDTHFWPDPAKVCSRRTLNVSLGEWMHHRCRVHHPNFLKNNSISRFEPLLTKHFRKKLPAKYPAKREIYPGPQMSPSMRRPLGAHLAPSWLPLSGIRHPPGANQTPILRPFCAHSAPLGPHYMPIWRPLGLHYAPIQRPLGTH